jgi:hypothetical protein
MNGVGIFVNYSFQADPDVNFDPAETNHPAKHRFNFDVIHGQHWLLSMSVQSAAGVLAGRSTRGPHDGGLRDGQRRLGYKFAAGKCALTFP